MSGLAILRNLVSRPSGAIGLGIVLFHILIAIIGPAIAPYDYAQQDVDAILQAPSAAHWFGTDRLGRDLFVRTLHGVQISLQIGLLATLVSLTIGLVYGATAGYIGGRLDELMMRFVDVLYSLPYIFIVIILSTLFERGNIFVLNRTRRDFTDRERALLEVLRPHLARIYQRMNLAGGLTARESEVLRWVSAGKSDAQIGAILRISARTVQKHLQNVYDKLGVESRTAAAMRVR